ncbi:phosphoribosylanthranilate isomerase [Bacillus sp. HMF5848]|uniref:phosphoribosylanthranilate isomerase n=1 Tax=Bacillus sp. HMF5848 TaxID=2495421 RepID=UPI000F7A5A30|nr:phosphoribosylanthranilate isomerase [Bacillus sp. HMF5848]RSK27425.1 phosphoribosylanthranilate isomerase [Bacillus sp. HMF5848]
MLLKYCGNKSYDDVKVTASSEANHLGFIFANSKREVQVSDVAKWLSEVNFTSKKIVAVFVNASLDRIKEVITSLPIDIIQLHGNESVYDIELLKNEINQPIWKVIHHQQGAWDKMTDYKNVVDGFVIDSKVGSQWGGSGFPFEWKSIPFYVRESHKFNKPCYIAGGVTPENIEVLLSYSIDGIDISSGIEERFKKDEDRIKQIEEKVFKYERAK